MTAIFLYTFNEGAEADGEAAAECEVDPVMVGGGRETGVVMRVARFVGTASR